jgi:outer membrane protein TolC
MTFANSQLESHRSPGRLSLLPAVSMLLAALLWFLPSVRAQDRPETLSVDQAVKQALANNRMLKITSLQLAATQQSYLAFKTHRLPTFNTYIFASELLAPISFTVPKGQFGFYPGIGYIPAENTPITTPQQPTAYVVASVTQPLLTLYKINIGLAGKGLSVDMAAQQLEGKRQSVVANVRETYYTALECEDAIAATEASIKQYEELERISTQYLAEQVVLKSELLEIQSKLAQSKLDLLKLQDKLETAKQTLNNLLGRDIHSPFQTAPAAELSPAEDNLPTAESKALEQNSDIKEAEITIKQAQNMVRQTKAKYLPDLDLSVHYLSPFGVNFVPTNIAGAGVEFGWEAWDWNRRKHEVNEKNLQVEETKVNLDETKSQVLLNVDKEYRSVHEAQAAVAAAVLYRESAREKLREVTQQYGQKTKLLRDVLQQQASVEKANSDYNEALASFWSARARLQKAMGEE